MPVALGTVASHRSAPTGPWTPAQLTALAGWWDADDATTFSFSSGTTISQWRDKSPNLLHLAPYYGPTVNLTRTGDINGRVAVLNSGSGAALARASVNVLQLVNAAGTDGMWFFASRFNADPGNDWGVTLDPNRISFYWKLSSTSYLDFTNYSTARLAANMAMTAGTPYVVALYRNGANMAIIRNGTTVATKSDASGSCTSAASTLWMMTEANAGHLGEVIFVARYDAADFAATQQYLTNKWMAAPPIPTTGLAGWWDAADAASITASGGVVSQWNDKSGLGRHVTQSPTGPTTGTRTMNGRNVLDFTSHTLQASGFTLTQPMMMVVALRADAVAGQFIGYVIGAAFLFDSGKWAMYSAGYLYSNVAADTAAHVVTGLLNGPTSQIWVDGAAQTPGNPGSTGTNAFRFGTSSGGSSPFDGTIAEIVVYDRVLSTVERQQVESYLKTKWGTP